MVVEVQEVRVTATTVTLIATDLEAMWRSDPFGIVDLPKVEFEFDCTRYGGAQYAYLFRLLKTQNKISSTKSFGDMAQSLCGEVVNIAKTYLKVA